MLCRLFATSEFSIQLTTTLENKLNPLTLAPVLTIRRTSVPLGIVQPHKKQVTMVVLRLLLLPATEVSCFAGPAIPHELAGSYIKPDIIGPRLSLA